ncbi:Clavaminate synthase-like protein [Dichomitus squalens]|uniref:Clavaminate synthase-like protein n=1 Tax=Dichomitus squalens TaxID=114155 RepID=A0A4Q9MEL8_9APHY|nr:Clavaminate synthase-like protein [Dichomitus squalens]
MPVATVPPVPHYTPAPPTAETLEWADLEIIDLSQASTPEGLAELALRVRDVMRSVGFMYVVNHGLTKAQTDRIFDIGNVLFTQVSEKERMDHAAKIQEEGSKIGYKPRQLWTIDNGVRDQHEQYALHRSICGQQKHPKALEPFLPELRSFSEHNHYNVLFPVLRLLALGMELPEETFVHLHEFHAVGDSHARFIKYHPRTAEEEIKTNGVWLKGHTDQGTVTILYSQPVSALQILSPDGKWRWVKHMDNALVVNVGDAMEMLSGGFYKGTIHRVVQPPADQRGFTRLGAYYFALPDDDVKLVPFKESLALQRVGIVRKCDDAIAPSMGEYRRARVMAYGLKATTKKGDAIEEQDINGIVLKHYN